MGLLVSGLVVGLTANSAETQPIIESPPVLVSTKETGNSFVLTAIKEGHITGDIQSNGHLLLTGKNVKVSGQANVSGQLKNLTKKLELTDKVLGATPLEDPQLHQAVLTRLSEGGQYQDRLTAQIKSQLVVSNVIHSKNIYLAGLRLLTINNSIGAQDSVLATAKELRQTGILYAEKGNITLSATDLSLNGFIYAPNGKVTIIGKKLNLTGAIYAKELSLVADTLHVTGSEEVAAFIKDQPVEIDTEPPSLQLTEPQSEEGYLTTPEATIDLSGVASDNQQLKQVTYDSYNGDQEKIAEGTMTGTTAWQQSLPLSIGMNYVTIRAEDAQGNVMEESLTIKRVTTEVTLKEGNVFVTDEEAIELANSFVSQVVDTKNTPDVSDDELQMTLRRDNLIEKAYQDKKLTIGHMIYLPSSPVIPAGYSGKLIRREEVKEGIRYVFSEPDISELFEEELSWDIDETVSLTEGLAYVMTADVSIVGGEYQEAQVTPDTVAERSKKPNHFVDLGELADFISPKIELGETSKFSLGDGKSGLRIYDHDGNSETKNDQISLLAELSLNKLTVDSAVDLNLKKGQVNQLRFAMEFQEETTNGLKFGGDFSENLGSGTMNMSKALKQFKDATNLNYKNELKFANLFKFEGVKMSDSIVLGFVGFKTGNAVDIQYGMSLTKYLAENEKSLKRFSPMVTFMILCDAKGSTNLQGTFSLGSTTDYLTGLNIQKKNYKGKDNKTTDDNKGSQTKEIKIGTTDYVVDVYDKKEVSSSTLEAQLKGQMKTELGLNVGIGVMLDSLMPALIKIGGYADTMMTSEAMLTYDLLNNQWLTKEIEGRFSSEYGLQGTAKACLKMKNTFDLKADFNLLKRPIGSLKWPVENDYSVSIESANIVVEYWKAEKLELYVDGKLAKIIPVSFNDLLSVVYINYPGISSRAVIEVRGFYQGEEVGYGRWN